MPWYYRVVPGIMWSIVADYVYLNRCKKGVPNFKFEPLCHHICEFIELLTKFVFM